MDSLNSTAAAAVGRLLFALAIKRRVTFEIEQRVHGIVYAERCPRCGHDGLTLHQGRRGTCPVCDCLLSEDYSTEGVVYRSGALRPGATRIEADCAAALAVASFMTAMEAYENSNAVASSVEHLVDDSGS